MKLSHIMVGLLVAVAGSGLEAQTSMTATIPFDFQMGSQAMPAGDYRIAYANGMVMLGSKDRGAQLLTIHRSRSKAADTGLLEFHRYGDTYFFAGVWAANSVDGGAVKQTRQEREFANRTVSVRPDAVALRIR